MCLTPGCVLFSRAPSFESNFKREEEKIDDEKNMSTNQAVVTNESFVEQKLLENFLRSTKLMKIIEDKTDQFINNYASSKKPEDARAAIILDLPLHYKDFVERAQSLLHLLVEEPLEFIDTAKYLIYSLITIILKGSSNSTLKTIDSEQIHVRFRLIGLPVQKELLYDITSNRYPGGLAVLNCVLSAYTEPESYTIQSIWYCTTGCQTNLIKKEVTKEPNCYNCARPMSEYSKLRYTGKYRLLKVFSIRSVSTPRVLNKIFRCQVVRLIDYTFDCDLILGANMESSETIKSSLSAVKSIPDAELDDLLVFSQKVNEDADFSDFQYHQAMEIPLHTTDLFRDGEQEQELTSNEKTQKYPPEFNLTFSLGAPDPTLLLNSQKTDRIELSCDSEQNIEESVFVHPQLKDEPLDLSVPSLIFSATTSSKLENNLNDDLDLEFSADPISPRKCSSTVKRAHESAVSGEEDPYQIGPSTSRRSPMEFLALSYSQTSLGEARTENARRDLYSSQNVQKDLTLVPKSVQRLYETIKMAYSDFAFVYSLSAQMCQDRVPMDCFVHLKIGLLLSIASLDDNPDRPPISIVAIGPEFGMANYLMETIGNVAERFVGPDDDFKVPPKKNSVHTWVEADPIVMAKGGIYYVGDWGRLSAPRSFRIFKTIECGRVALEKSTVTCQLEAAIWTHWRSYKYDTKDQHTFNKFLEIFGIPLIIEDENHEVLVDFMLEQASIKTFESTIDELSICADDIREFLSIISKRRVDLSDEASEMLRKYFVATRMDRPDCLTQKSFSTLKLFAESFAKLSLRHDVILIDAISAIYMTENLIQNVFGPGVYPPPKFQVHTYIGAVDEHMVQFQEWVKNYISHFLDKD